MQASEIREKYWSYKGHRGVWKEILPLLIVKNHELGLAQLPQCHQLGLSTVEVSYHVWKADIGKTLDESLAQPWELQEQGFVLLLYDFVFLLNVLQVLLHGGDLWSKEHSRVTNPHQRHPPTPCTPGLECTAKDTNLGLEFHHGRFHLWVGLVQLTDLLVQLLDLLIVLQNWRREGHRQSTNALGKSKSVGLSAEHCPHLGFYSLETGRTSHLPFFFFFSIIFIINIFIITVQCYLNRSICKCKSKGQQSSWSPTHPHTRQGWLSWTIRSLFPILSLEWCHLKN